MLRGRLRAIARILGPSITLEAVLPGGRVINHSHARSTASGIRRLLGEIRSHLQTDQHPPQQPAGSGPLEHRPESG